MSLRGFCEGGQCRFRNGKVVGAFQNHFLDSLSRAESMRLRPQLVQCVHSQGEILYQPGDAVANIYFPQTAVICNLVCFDDGRSAPFNLVGAEGLVGIGLALGAETTQYQAVVQIAGSSWKISTKAFRKEVGRSIELRDRLEWITRQFIAQTAQTAACNRVHHLDQRLTRWLLMTYLRTGHLEFPITHEFLSYMLGADRSEVTFASGRLRKRGYISSRRGTVTIIDLKKLESAACECYQADRRWLIPVLST